MESFGLYLLKSVTWIAGFALVFILFLRNERFFFLNRIYLLAGILTSFLFPLISIHYTVILPVIQTVPADNAVVNEIQNTGKSVLPDLKIILLALYASGVLFVIALMLRQGKSVLRTIKKSETISLRPVKLIKTSDYTSAFSFFSYVFVNPSITDVETKEIMIHEMVHIRQKHWVDLLLVELLCMIQWFNPLVWIYVRFIRQNHEYLADEVALQQTSDPAIYKAVLLNQIVGAPVVSLSNSFNYSPNKKRFAMMKNIITSPYRKMKVLLILPVFALVLFSFARPDYKYKYLNDSSANFNASSEEKSVKGKVVSEENKPLPGATVVVRGTFNGASADNKGYFKIDNVPADGNLVVSFVGFKSKVLKPDFNSDMTIKMVRDTVKLSRLEEVAPPPPQPPVPPVDNIKEIKDVPPPPSLNDAPPPLYVVDGTIVTKAEAEKISPETIASVNVLKDKKEIKPATEKYGEKGENGVVEITTKADMDKMLVVIDGVVKENVKLSEINSVTIASMNVLNRQGAIDKYGEKGKNGVAELITKSNDSSLTNQGSKPFVVVEELPQFQGGTDAMLTWIAANIKYPAEAIQGKIEGKVYVNFTVSTSGKVKDAVVIKSVSPTLNEEAIRVISSMPDWKPGMQAGKPVEVQYRVPVEFKLK
jgi:TonB family protein